MRWVIVAAMLVSVGAACNRPPENLRYFKQLTVWHAKELAKGEGDLHLSGLTALSDAAAEALSLHKGERYLDGLTTLSDQQAEGLAKHTRYLSLNGLTALSDKAAALLWAMPHVQLPGRFMR